MLFTTYIFIFLFLPITFVSYFGVSRLLGHGPAKLVLLIASLVFYSYWDVKYLGLISLSILVNYYTISLLSTNGRQLEEGLSRKSILVIALMFNLGLLGYFKYADFFIVNVNMLLGTELAIRNVVLPLAISFFTFQQIAYLIDQFKEPARKPQFLGYSLFVVFFPQLIAGPIVRSGQTLPQFANLKLAAANSRNILFGLILFGIGVFKKVVIADSLVADVATGFGTAQSIISFGDAWLAALSYSFQLYFDFSGYADMAVGLGLMFNITLPVNFNSPYKSLNIQDFWRRWHITLGQFLRQYVYIPLGGNRAGEFAVLLNLLITFLLGGLWHGAGWTFVVWGALHGVALCLHRIWQKYGVELPKVVAWFITMCFVITAWVFFRAPDINSALLMTKSMYDVSGFVAMFTELSLIGGKSFLYLKLLACAVICILLKNSNQIVLQKLALEGYQFSNYQIVFFAALFVAGVCGISLQDITEFIYFDF